MLALLCLSGLFSGGETALFCLSRSQIAGLRTGKTPFHHFAAYLAQNPRRLLMTVLFGNMTVNVAFYALAATLSARIGGQYGPAWAAASGAAALLTVILFGEVTPKNLAAAAPRPFALIVSAPLWGLQWLVGPVRWALTRVAVTPLTRLITGRKHLAEHHVTTEELQDAVRLSAGQGALSAEETDMLGHVLAMGEMKVKEVMTPRVRIVGCDISAPPAEAARILRESRLGKIPVWHGTADNIAGLVYAKDVLLNPSRPLAEALQSVWYVPETKRLDSLLRDFRRLKIQLAIAVDEYGGTAGLVTGEDCMGRIVGQADGGAEARGDA